jgi:phosphoserine aminotransferase
VMEMSHRGKEFMGIAAEAERDLRELLAIPAHYRCCSCRAAPRCSSRRCR